MKQVFYTHTHTNNYTTGLYFMSLVAEGQVVDQKTFIIN